MKHLIYKQIFDIQTVNETKAKQLQKEIFDLFYKKLEQITEQIFDEFSNKNQIWRIEKLNIDLGNLTDLDNFAQKYAQSLRAELKKLQNETIFSPSKQNLIIQQPQSDLDQLDYFLKNGVFAWNYSKQNPAELLDQILDNQPDKILFLLQKYANFSYVRRRLVRQFSEKSLQKIVQILEPQEAPFIIAYVTDLQEVQKKEPIIKASQNDFKQVIWDLVFDDLLLDRGTSFNRKMFVKRNLELLAQRYGINESDLILMFAEAVAKIQRKIAFKTSLPALIEEIANENTEVQIKKIGKLDVKKTNSAKIIQEILSQKNISFDFSKFTFLQIQEILKAANQVQRKKIFENLSFQKFTFVQIQKLTLFASQKKPIFKTLYKQNVIQNWTEKQQEQANQQIAEKNAPFVRKWLAFLTLTLQKNNIFVENSLKKILSQITLSFFVQNNAFSTSFFVKKTLLEVSKKISVSHENLLGYLFDNQTKTKIIPALTKVLDKIYTEHIDSQNLQKNLPKQIAKVYENSWQILKFYLKFGALPYAFAQENAETFLMQVIEQQPDSLISFLKENKNDVFLRRLAESIKKENLLEIVKFFVQKNYANNFLKTLLISSNKEADYFTTLQKSFLELENIDFQTFINYLDVLSPKLTKLLGMTNLAEIKENLKKIDEIVFERNQAEIRVVLLASLQKSNFFKVLALLFGKKENQIIKIIVQNAESASNPKQFFSELLDTISQMQEINLVEIIQKISLLSGDKHEIALRKLLKILQKTGFLSVIQKLLGEQISHFFVQSILQNMPESSQETDYFKKILEAIIQEKNIDFEAITSKKDQIIEKKEELISTNWNENLTLIKSYLRAVLANKKIPVQSNLDELLVFLLDFPEESKWFLSNLSEHELLKIRELANEKTLNIILETAQNNDLDKKTFLKNTNTWLSAFMNEEEKTSAVLSYLRLGNLRANISQKMIEDLITQTIKQKPAKLKLHLLELLENANIRKIWAKKLSEKMLIKLLHLVFPMYSTQILKYSKIVKTVLESSNLIKKNILTQWIWESVFSYISKNYHKNFKFIQFISEKLFFLQKKINYHTKIETEELQRLLSQITKQLSASERRIVEKITKDFFEKNKIIFKKKIEKPKKKVLQDVSSKIGEQLVSDAIFVNNAGLILLHPYYIRLFQMFNLKKGLVFKDLASAMKGAHILQFLVNGKTDLPEHELVLNKILCGIKTFEPLDKQIELSDQEKESCLSLIAAVTQHWTILKNTSVEGFQSSFLQREGKLTENDEHWQLVVEPKTFDVVIDQIPWQITTVKLPDMPKPLYVQWR